MVLAFPSSAAVKKPAKKKAIKKTAVHKNPVKKKLPPRKPKTVVNPLQFPLWWVEPWPASLQGVWIVYASTAVTAEGNSAHYQSQVPLPSVNQQERQRRCAADPNVSKRLNQIKSLKPGSTLDYFTVRMEAPGARSGTVFSGSGETFGCSWAPEVVCQLEAGKPLQSFVALACENVPETVKEPWLFVANDGPPLNAQAAGNEQWQKLAQWLKANPLRDPWLTYAVLGVPQLKELASDPVIAEGFQQALSTKWSSIVLSPYPVKPASAKALVDITGDGTWDYLFVEEKGDLELIRAVYGQDKLGIPMKKAEFSKTTFY